MQLTLVGHVKDKITNVWIKLILHTFTQNILVDLVDPTISGFRTFELFFSIRVDVGQGLSINKKHHKNSSYDLILYLQTSKTI